MRYTRWHDEWERPGYNGYYDVRFGKDETIHRWQWLNGHWYDMYGRLRNEPVEFRGSAVPLHRSWCNLTKANGDPCNCFLRYAA